MIAVLLFIVFSVVFIIPRNTVNNLQGRNSTELTAVESKEGNQRRLDYVDEKWSGDITGFFRFNGMTDEEISALKAKCVE